MLEQYNNELVEENKKKGLKAVGKFFIGVLRVMPSILVAIGIFLIVAIVSLAILFLPYFSTFKTVYLDVHAAAENVKLAQNYLENAEFDKAEQPLTEASDRFAHAREELHPLLGSYYKRINYIHQQLLGIDDLLEIGEQISDSLLEVSRLGITFIDILQTEDLSFQNISVQQKHEILGALKKAGPQLDSIRDKLELAMVQLDEFNDRPIFPLIKAAASPISEDLPKYEPLFREIAVYGKILPDIMGYDRQQNYLFLLQNNDELRPGGGFIGTYGIIKVKDAEFLSFFTDNIYNIDYPARPYLKIPTPKQFKDYMKQDYWFMRDANWWHDYPTSAKKVENFYHLENGPVHQIDGVVAIDQTFIESLLDITGPIEVDGISFTQGNFTEKLQFEVEKGFAEEGIPEAERKAIIGDLSKEILNRLFNLPRSEWVRLLSSIEQNLEEKHLLLYLKQTDVQNQISDLNWTGEVYMGDDDYLAVVDANLAALKTDSTMNRSYHYYLEEKEDGLYAKVKLFYENTGQFTWKTTRYRTYNRIYVPLGSELISYRFDNELVDLTEIDNFEELGKQTFGYFFVVEPKESKTVEIVYKLPEKVRNQLREKEYNLIIQKQPGLDVAGLSVEMKFIKPFRGQSAIFNRKGDSVEWQGDMAKDMEFRVEF